MPCEHGHPLLYPLLLLAVVLTPFGCGTSQTIHQQALSQVHLSVADAQGNSETDTLELDLRRQPARCDAPPWQARLWGRWQRVELANPPEDIDDSSVFRQKVKITNRTVEDSNGWRYPVLEIIPEGESPGLF